MSWTDNREENAAQVHYCPASHVFQRSHFIAPPAARLLSTPADDNKELEQQQSQVLLLGLQAIGGFLDALQQLVAQNLQDVVGEERQHRGKLLRPGDTQRGRKKCLKCQAGVG